MNKVNRSCFLCPFKNWLTVCLSYILSTFLGERANDFILLSDNAPWEWIPNTPNYPAGTAEPQSRHCPAINPWPAWIPLIALGSVSWRRILPPIKQCPKIFNPADILILIKVRTILSTSGLRENENKILNLRFLFPTPSFTPPLYLQSSLILRIYLGFRLGLCHFLEYHEVLTLRTHVQCV